MVPEKQVGRATHKCGDSSQFSAFEAVVRPLYESNPHHLVLILPNHPTSDFARMNTVSAPTELLHLRLSHSRKQYSQEHRKYRPENRDV